MDAEVRNKLMEFGQRVTAETGIPYVFLGGDYATTNQPKGWNCVLAAYDSGTGVVDVYPTPPAAVGPSEAVMLHEAAHGIALREHRPAHMAEVRRRTLAAVGELQDGDGFRYAPELVAAEQEAWDIARQELAPKLGLQWGPEQERAEEWGLASYRRLPA